MNSIETRTLPKAATLLILTTLILGSASALNWVNPDQGTYQDEITLNVSNDNDASQINFTIDGPNSDSTSIDATGQEYVTYDFTAGSNNGGDYQIIAESSQGESSEIEITIDRNSPDVEKGDQDTQYVSDNPSLEFSVSDPHSDVVSLSASASNEDIDIDDPDREDVCGAGGECTETFDLSIENFANGDTFPLEVTAEDGVGFSDTYTFDYTYDDSFEADQPEFSIPDADDNNDVHVTGDVEVDVTVGNIDEETSSVRVTCFVDGEELDQTDFEDENDFSCDLPEDDLEDGDSDVSVEACDQAGNCETSDERSFTFDSSPPILDRFSAVQNYKKFGGGFEAEFSAEDPDSGIQKAEYFFSTAVLPGEGNDVDQVDDERFTVEESEITTDDVDQTVYLRVMNDVGQWSDRESVEFEYYPDEAPEMSLDVPENVTVVAGEQKSFDVVVENTGTLLVDSVNVKASSDVFEGTEELSDVSELETATFDLSPNQSQIGRYEVTVETDGPVDSASFDLLVEANEEQRQQIESRLSDLSSEAEKVRSNISGLRSDGIDSDLNRTIEEDIDPFVQKVERAENLTQQGKYYVAQNALESVEQLERSAEDSLKQVRKEDRVRERNRLIKMVLAVLAVLVAAVIGLLVYARREDIGEKNLSIEKFDVPDMSNTRDKFYDLIDGIREKVEELEDEIDQKEEEADKKFEGFK